MKRVIELCAGLAAAFVISLIFAGAFRLLWTIPTLAVAGLIFLLFILEIFEEGGGVDAVVKWSRRIGKAALVCGGFILVWFLVGQVFGFYPAMVYADLHGAGGISGVLWGQAPRSIVVEVLVVALAGWVAAKRGKGGAKFAIFAIGLIAIIWVMFPLWTGTWPKTRQKIDESLATKGVAATVGDFPRRQGSSTNVPTMMSEGGNELARDVCAQVVADDFEQDDINRVDIILKGGNCLGQAVTLPARFAPGFKIETGPGTKFYFLCPGRPVTLLPPGNGSGAMSRCGDPQKGPTPRFFAGGHGIVTFIRSSPE